MATTLFRTIQPDAQLMPGVLDLGPPASSTLTAFLAVAAALLVAFVAVTPYARKQSAVGLVVAQAGTIRVSPAQPGTLAALHVADGDVVEAGACLFTVDYRRSLAEGGTLDASVRQALRSQELLLQGQIASEATRSANERAGLESRIAGLMAERRGLVDQHAILGRRVALAAERFDGVADLRRRGLLTETDFRAREDAWLARQQDLTASNQRIEAIGHQVQQAAAQVAQLAPDSTDRLSRLRGALAGLQGGVAQAAAGSGEVVRAPAAGRVTALQTVQGQHVDPAKPVLALVPLGGTLHAELFVPSRAIGLLEPGQAVRLSYDAFPFQRFGTYTGTVGRVSAAMLTPDEVTGPLRPLGPSYRVSVLLDRQQVTASGREVPLQPDMTLRADIVLEQRTVLGWLLDPVWSALPAGVGVGP